MKLDTLKYRNLKKSMSWVSSYLIDFFIKKIGYTMQAQNISFVKTSKAGCFRVLLTLPFQTRHIGSFDESNKIFISSPRSERHLFRKSNSLGISQEILNLDVHIIIIPYQNQNLYITKSHCLKVGKSFCFSSKGYEAQTFIPLSALSYSELEAKQKSKILFPQMDLFRRELSYA